MPVFSNTTTVNEIFFGPLQGLTVASPFHYPCRELDDELWLLLGVDRVLKSARSGRGFLQEHAPSRVDALGHSTYFASLNSSRRQRLAGDVNEQLMAAATPLLRDRLDHMPELARYEIFAVDGHWHQAATHDPRHEGQKMAVGHFHSLNLRNHLLRPLAVGEGLHEHDISVLKRLKPSGLRQKVAKGRRVLAVYDRASIDYGFWKRCRQECAVYFLSRTKEGLVFEWISSRLWNRNDPRNRGISDDRQVLTPEGHTLRVIHYTDPLTGKFYEFLTNDMELSPGVLAELYRRRWEIEKVFDELKNQLEERKAWGTSLDIRRLQGHLTALTHNLMVIYEQHLERAHGVQNIAEDRRRETRLDELKDIAAQTCRGLSSLLLSGRRATQRSIKFLRWLRHALATNLAETLAVTRLRRLYARL